MLELRLFQTADGNVSEFAPRLAEAEADVQRLVEANMEALLGVRFLASEYGTGPVHAGRIDSLGLDANGAPVVVEYKRGTDPGVINQGLFYLSWLVDHRSEFEQLVRDRLGSDAAARVLWSEPRLICVAGDYTRYDLHAVREHWRSIDLVRYRFFGTRLIGLETLAAATGRSTHRRRKQRTEPVGAGCKSIVELAAAADGPFSASATASLRCGASTTAPIAGCRISQAFARRSEPRSTCTSRSTPQTSTSSPISSGTCGAWGTTEQATLRYDCGRSETWSVPLTCSAPVMRRRERPSERATTFES